MTGLPFVDAHAHLWDLRRISYPWLKPPFGDGGPNGNVESIATTYLLDDYRHEAARWNVVGMVHVEAGADLRESLAETDWLQAMADREGMPNGIVAFAALDCANLETRLFDYKRRANVRGIRHIVNWHADPDRSYTLRDVTRDEAWQAGFARLGRHGLSFDLQAYPGQFPGLAELFARHPEIPVIVNHTGMGINGEEDWLAGMRPLAALDHVSVKISGMGFVWRPLDPAAIRARVLRTIDLFGAGRCMFASNFPTDRLFGGFDETLGLLADSVANLSEAERRALWAGNANRIYRLNLDLRGEDR